jgi:cytochrome P450
MSQAEVALGVGSRGRGTDGQEVAPFIAAAVGDVARPRARLLPTTKLGHLPGESGLLVGFKNVSGWMNRGVDHLLDKQRRFGLVFRSQLGPSAFVHVADPELIARITRNEDRAWSSALAWYAMFTGVDPTRATMDYTVTMDFDLHRDARKLLQPAFSAAATASYLDMAMPLFETAIDSWVQQGGVDFKAAIRSLLARASTRSFLGVNDDAEASAIERATADVWGTLFAVLKNRWLSRAHRRSMDGHAYLRSALRPRIAERRASGGEDLFSRLCAETRGAAWLDDEGVVRLFLGILLAAFDTTASALASMAYLLAKHPEWQERLRDEALGLHHARISAEDTKRLELGDRAWKETLRLMPVTGGIPRYTLRDVTLGDWQIPAGAFVDAMVGPALRSETHWTHADQFDPERFSAERGEDRAHKGLFLPFGSGAHACIGLHLATVEAKAFWHAMLTRCRFRLARDYVARHTYVPLGIVSGDVKLVLEPLG